MTFGFEFGEHFGSELIIAFLEALVGALQTGFDLGGVEILQRLISQSFHQGFAILADVIEAMPGLLGHGFMNHLADVDS